MSLFPSKSSSFSVPAPPPPHQQQSAWAPPPEEVVELARAEEEVARRIADVQRIWNNHMEAARRAAAAAPPHAPPAASNSNHNAIRMGHIADSVALYLSHVHERMNQARAFAEKASFGRAHPGGFDHAHLAEDVRNLRAALSAAKGFLKMASEGAMALKLAEEGKLTATTLSGRTGPSRIELYPHFGP